MEFNCRKFDVTPRRLLEREPAQRSGWARMAHKENTANSYVIFGSSMPFCQPLDS